MTSPMQDIGPATGPLVAPAAALHNPRRIT